jgi:hypothetical protein
MASVSALQVNINNINIVQKPAIQRANIEDIDSFIDHVSTSQKQLASQESPFPVPCEELNTNVKDLIKGACGRVACLMNQLHSQEEDKNDSESNEKDSFCFTLKGIVEDLEDEETTLAYNSTRFPQSGKGFDRRKYNAYIASKNIHIL